MISIVTASDVSLELPGGRVLFSNLNFSIQPKLTALVGPNGIGKTCLAKLLIGESHPTSGHIRRTTNITFFPQREQPMPITVDEFLSANCAWSPLKDTLLKGIDGKNLCTHLSGGQWIRVRLSRTIDEQFLILDEPTNDLDRDGRQALFHFLKARVGGALLISHDRECLQLCQDILELSNRGLSKFGDGWDLYEQFNNRERENLFANLEKMKRDRDAANSDRLEQKTKQEKRNQRGAAMAARGSMPKILTGARKRRAQSTTGRIDSETMKRADQAVNVAHEAFADLKINPVMYADLVGKEIHAQKLVVEAHQFNIKFKDWLYPNDLNFSWRGNIRLSLKGANGSGKTTLLNAILGQRHQTRGELRIGNLDTLYIDQRCAILDESKNIFETIQEVASLDESEIRKGLAKFLFMQNSVFQNVASLSGGERLRTALARGLLTNKKPELLILDEPTNNLDLANIEFLEKLVSEFKGAVIVISHDKVFIENCKITDEFNVSQS